MSERTVLQTEDPLPTTYDNDTFNPFNPESTLGEIVVTDTRDPFVWLSTLQHPEFPLSEPAKQLLWNTYRLNGNMPRTEDDIKWRDHFVMNERAVEGISDSDMRIITQYESYIVQQKPRRLGRHVAEATVASPAQLETYPAPISIQQHVANGPSVANDLGMQPHEPEIQAVEAA